MTVNVTSAPSSGQERNPNGSPDARTVRRRVAGTPVDGVSIGGRWSAVEAGGVGGKPSTEAQLLDVLAHLERDLAEEEGAGRHGGQQVREVGGCGCARMEAERAGIGELVLDTDAVFRSEPFRRQARGSVPPWASDVTIDPDV